MKGYIKIEVGTHGDKEGLFVDYHIEDASIADRFMLMHFLKKVLQMDDTEWKLYVVGEHKGFFDDMSEVEDLTDEG